jgi:hypothetical protein
MHSKILGEEIADPFSNKKWKYVGTIVDDPLEYIEIIARL